MAKKTSKRQTAQKAKLQDYVRTFESDHGQRVLWDLFRETEFLEFNTVAGDPYSTSFNDGRRSVLLHIIGKLKIEPKKLLNIIEKGVEDEIESFNDIDE